VLTRKIPVGVKIPIPRKEIMEKNLIVFFILAIVSMSSAYGHKLINHDDTHTSFDSAL